jgi:hypothetical protein
LGFSADQTNPFGGGAGRVKPFHDFDIASVGWTGYGFACWPKVQNVSDKTTGPIVYFRAEGSNYTFDGSPAPAGHVPTALAGSNFKYEGNRTGDFVAPAVDTRLSNFKGMTDFNSGKAVVYTWVNPQSFQLFSSGLDQKYVTPYIAGTLNANVDCVTYPTGESYRDDKTTNSSSYDDITNFSTGTLESDKP